MPNPDTTELSLGKGRSLRIDVEDGVAKLYLHGPKCGAMSIRPESNSSISITPTGPGMPSESEKTNAEP